MFTPGKKSYHHLDSIFKSRDITLPTKVRLVKAMVFLLVMYGCESWTVKKAELQRFDGVVMDRESWSAVIHGVTKSRTRLSD